MIENVCLESLRVDRGDLIMISDFIPTLKSHI